MTANIVDKFSNPSSGVRPVSTTVSTLRNAGGTTLACADLTGWATDTAVHFVTYKIDGAANVVVGSQSDWKGIVSGSNINNLTLTGGTDAGNAAGDIVEMLPTVRWGKELTDGIRVEHNQDGTHGTIANLHAGNLTATGTLSLPSASITSSNIDFSTFANGGQLKVQTKVVFTGASGTLADAGSVYCIDVAVSGTWTTPFTTLLSCYVITDNNQFWTSIANPTTTGFGGVRLYKFSSFTQNVTVTVVGIGI